MEFFGSCGEAKVDSKTWTIEATVRASKEDNEQIKLEINLLKVDDKVICVETTRLSGD